MKYIFIFTLMCKILGIDLLLNCQKNESEVLNSVNRNGYWIVSFLLGGLWFYVFGSL